MSSPPLKPPGHAHVRLIDRRFDNTAQVPRGIGLYYRCSRCGKAISSQPTESVGCACGNLFIDVDYHRLVVNDFGAFDLLEREIAPRSNAKSAAKGGEASRVAAQDARSDYFQLSKQLASQLAALGFVAQAQLLNDAIDGASTGTEIHMALRHHLRSVADAADLDSELRATAKQLVARITKALRG